MATIAENLQIIKDSTTAIKQAIIDKGGTISGGLTTYADAILNISGGGGSGSIEQPIIGDGKTYLYINLHERRDVPIKLNQSVSNGVNIDWGDGTPTETIDGTNTVSKTHTYTKAGKYVITLVIKSGSAAFLGLDGVYKYVLEGIELGGSMNAGYAVSLAGYYSLTFFYSSGSFLGLGTETCSGCYALKNVFLSSSFRNGLTNMFYNCNSLTSFSMPPKVTEVSTGMFNKCTSMQYYDFSQHTSIPTLQNTNAFGSIPADCKIIVPDNLYNNWKSVTNWSTYASYIIKKSTWDNGGTTEGS